MTISFLTLSSCPQVLQQKVKAIQLPDIPDIKDGQTEDPSGPIQACEDDSTKHGPSSNSLEDQNVQSLSRLHEEERRMRIRERIESSHCAECNLV